MLSCVSLSVSLYLYLQLQFVINNFNYICLFFIETYISCWSLFILCDTALQVERQVMTADQDSLPELLFKLPHIWLNAREIQFLWKQEMLLKVINCLNKSLLS